jgi:hypothetical protein
LAPGVGFFEVLLGCESDKPNSNTIVYFPTLQTNEAAHPFRYMPLVEPDLAEHIQTRKVDSDVRQQVKCQEALQTIRRDVKKIRRAFSEDQQG